MRDSSRSSLGLSVRVVLALGAGLVGYAFVANALGFDPLPGIGAGRVVDATRLAGAGLLVSLAGFLLAPELRRRLLDWVAAAAPATPVLCVSLGVWSGLALGLVEVLHQACRKFGFGVILRQPFEFVWMAPLSYAAALGVAGAVLAAAARLLPRRVTLPVVVFVFAAFAAASQCLFYPWHRVSMAIFALGIAVQAARVAATRPARLVAAVRRSAPVLALVVVSAGLAIPVARIATERRVMAALPGAAADAPNVLLVVLDTVRADHLGAYGYARDTTPAVDALAAGSVVFERALSTSPWTLPSHASMFTGRYPQDLSADWLTPLDDRDPTLAEVLASHGYATGGFVGNLAYCLREHGLGRGFAHYEDFADEPAVVGFSTAVGERLLVRAGGNSFNELLRNDATHVTDRALRWLESVGERPFFAFLNYYDAHTYYLAPPPFDAQFGPISPHLRDWYTKKEWSAAERQGFVDAYDGCVAYIDAQVGRLLATLRALGRLDDTVVVITADHGELFWEHGLTEHGNCLYRPVLHVPLVVYDPRRPGGPRRVADLVTLRDLPATLLDLAGLDPGLLPGYSLARHWRDDAAPPPRPSPLIAAVSQGIGTAETPHSWGDMESVVVDGLHYIRNGDGTEEVYDFQRDPAEEHNLVDSVGAKLEELRAALRGR